MHLQCIEELLSDLAAALKWAREVNFLPLVRYGALLPVNSTSSKRSSPSARSRTALAKEDAPFALTCTCEGCVCVCVSYKNLADGQLAD